MSRANDVIASTSSSRILPSESTASAYLAAS